MQNNNFLSLFFSGIRYTPLEFNSKSLKFDYFIKYFGKSSM